MLRGPLCAQLLTLTPELTTPTSAQEMITAAPGRPDAPVPRLRGRGVFLFVRRLALALIAAGLVLAVAPALAVRLWDGYLAFSRDVEVRQWALETAGRTADAVIEPGASGYLLEIPKLGLRGIVRELEPTVFSGKNTPTLKRYGMGQIPYTDALRNVSPGAEGTAAIAGHRTTSGAPFRNLHRLGPGDLIIIRSGATVQEWEVVYSTVVVPSEVTAIRSQPGTQRLAILACNPPFSARQRIVVYAQLRGTAEHKTKSTGGS